MFLERMVSAGRSLGTSDVAIAFLQCNVSASRPESLLMTPPRDPISTLAVFPHSFYEVVSSINGLIAAPALFNKHARRLLQDVGGQPHPLDCMMFMSRDKDVITCILCAHVDGLGHPNMILLQQCCSSFQNTFEYGKWTEPDNHVLSILLCSPSVTRAENSSSGKPRAHTQVISTGGDRIEISSGLPNCCHLPRDQILQRAAHSLKWLLVGFSDASFNNASGERTQLALLVTLTTKAALTSTQASRCSLLEWRSHRSRRVAHSTLSAWTIAGDTCIDTLQYLSAFIGILVHDDPLEGCTS
eukprot:6481929-Amphidinium_carterae.2